MIRLPGMLLISAVSLLSFVVGSAELAEAALLPEEIVIVVNANASESVRLGELYVQLRDVPADHLIKLDISNSESISRKEYDDRIAGPVRKAVNVLYRAGKRIRCIITTYGIPLRINALRPLMVSEEDIKKHSEMIKKKKKELADLRQKRKESNKHNEKLENETRKLRQEVDELGVELGHMMGSDTVAAVDSELALLLVPDYPLAGWQLNPEFLYNRGRVFYFGKVLMVSRLDAPTSELAERLIRTAIEVEKNGLSGKLYLDARGLTGKDAYALFDEEIRRTAQVLKRSSMPVILDNRPQLFSRGEAPSAALYCGWYSINKYRDAFQWSEGAVGYHVASAEAVSLHDANAQYWVKSMIEKGVIGSLGPVAEPYLNAFPLPSLFFPFLMSGKYTFAEVFAMTNPYLSWRMILVGDPLYNPFKNNPAFVLNNAPPPPE